MRKTVFLLTLAALCAPCAYAADVAAGLEFYKKEISAFPADTNRETRAAAKALADGLNTWAAQNPASPAVKDAMLMQARLYLRAQENGYAAVTLFRLRNLYPQTDMNLLTPLMADAVQAVQTNRRDQATNLFIATRQDGEQTAAQREAQALYALSKLSGRGLYTPGSEAFEAFFVRYPSYEENDKVELWYGDFHRENGNYLAAISQYKKAAELYPNTPYKAASLRLIGDIYADNLKDTASATAAYTRVLRDFEGSAETGIVYKHMAILDENNKQYDGALINYDKAIELLGATPTAYEAYRGKADVYAKTKNYEAAYNTLHQTAALFGSDEEKSTASLKEAAKIAKKYLRDQTKYTQSLEKALLAHPSGPNAAQLMFDLGQAYEQAGKNVQAVEMYKKLIINYPTDKLSSRAQGKLNKLTK